MTPISRRWAERADVLGQAATAEAEARSEELAADPLVMADRVGELDDVRARGLAHSAMALINEILVARNALAATLTSSAVSRSISRTGIPEPMGVA